MDSFRIHITPNARHLLNRYIDYIQYTLLDEQGADAVLLDALETIDILEMVADSITYCESKELRNLGYHKILFQRHKYVMIYKIVEDVVSIDAIYHQLQDYEKLFIKDLNIK